MLYVACHYPVGKFGWRFNIADSRTWWILSWAFIFHSKNTNADLLPCEIPWCWYIGTCVTVPMYSSMLGYLCSRRSDRTAVNMINKSLSCWNRLFIILIIMVFPHLFIIGFSFFFHRLLYYTFILCYKILDFQ